MSKDTVVDQQAGVGVEVQARSSRQRAAVERDTRCHRCASRARCARAHAQCVVAAFPRLRVTCHATCMGQLGCMRASAPRRQPAPARVARREGGAAAPPSRRAASIWTSDSNSPHESRASGAKCGQRARSASGSLDRLYLGHFCTDGPENASRRTARAAQWRGRTENRVV